MDTALATEDLAFQAEVREFLTGNAMAKGQNYMEWREHWFAAARAKGGWDVPRWPKTFGGPGWSPTQHYIWENETARTTLPLDLPFGIGMLAPSS